MWNKHIQVFNEHFICQKKTQDTLAENDTIVYGFSIGKQFYPTYPYLKP